MFDDIRLRPLCANGLNGQPECRSLIRAMQDMGWDMARRGAFWRDCQRVCPDGKPCAEYNPARCNRHCQVEKIDEWIDSL